MLTRTAGHFDLLDAQRILIALYNEYPELRFWPKVATDIIMRTWQNLHDYRIPAEEFIATMREPMRICYLGWLILLVLNGDLEEISRADAL